MSDQYPGNAAGSNWNEFFEQANQQFVEALETNMEAQAEFVESWSETIEASTDDDRLSEGVEGYARAYEVWMEAADQMVERAEAAAEDEEFADVEEFRDIWLNTANQAFKEVMSTSAFAAATGQSVQDALELQQTANESAEATLHNLGMATEGDIREVGDRLVELERRQHEVERKLDRVLEHLEE